MLIFNKMGLLAAVICCSTASSATGLRANEAITGSVSIIDGDTFEIHGQRIRLAGIDAPESGQRCYTESGSSWPCGQKITQNLSKLLSRKTITCTVSNKDRYGRHIGTCFYKNRNINAMIVRAGWAMAYRRYSTAYIVEERKAQEEGYGIWAGPFIPPWKWRKGVRYE